MFFVFYRRVFLLEDSTTVRCTTTKVSICAGRKETRRRETGRKETRRQEMEGKANGSKESGVGETVAKESGERDES